MAYFLFFDTETTGFAKDVDANDPSQAVVVQLAFKLLEPKTKRVVMQAEFIVDNGVYIADHLVNIHGVDQELASDVGVTPSLMVEVFEKALNMSAANLAFNHPFDKRMMDVMRQRAGFGEIFTPASLEVCVMEMAKPYCGLMDKKGNIKKPTLSQALEVLCGREHEGAHNAMNDVDAMIDVFYACQALNDQQAGQGA